ncbi:hypothetical protein M2271_006436 [Streptomyces sp. LBL]|nr:hypothetical protein [Streptomyces sp. LBL]
MSKAPKPPTGAVASFLPGPPIDRTRVAWAMISAVMETAVSSGVRAPRSRPIGERSRANWSAVTPSSVRRRRRSSWVRREPIAPT